MLNSLLSNAYNTIGAVPMVSNAEVTPQLFRHLHIYWRPIMRRNIICLYDLHHPSNFFLPISQPSAGNPSTQPPIRRLALPLIRSITQPNARASSYQPTTQSPSFHQPRHTLQTNDSLPPPAIPFVPTALTPHPTNTGVSSKSW